MATKQDIVELRTELKLEIANHKAEISKWMFIFWIGQLTAMLAITIFLIKK